MPKLLQYKSEHYAKRMWLEPEKLGQPFGYLTAEPGIPNDDQMHWSGSALYVARRAGEFKKFVLMELERKTVHGTFDLFKEEFIFVTTVNPYEPDPMIAAQKAFKFWVKAEWVEHLTSSKNYEAEQKAELLKKLKEGWRKPKNAV